MSVTPTSTGAKAPTGGVGWAKDDHAICVVGEQGKALERFGRLRRRRPEDHGQSAAQGRRDRGRD